MATQKAARFDLGGSEFDTKAACEAGAEIQLRSPATNDPIPVYWSVVGTDSEQYRKFIAGRVREESKKEITLKARGKQPDPTELEDLERNALNLVAACSTGWRTLLEDGTSLATLGFKGEDLPFSRDNAKMILRERPWIIKQLDTAIGDIQNFISSK